MNRRNLLTSIAALCASLGVGPLRGQAAWADGAASGAVKLGTSTPFSRDLLIDQVRKLSGQAYKKPPQVPQDWIDLNYDQYRGINFNRESALWRETQRPFELEFFAPGLYFPSPIMVSVVEGNEARPVLFSKRAFNFSQAVPPLSDSDALGYSGFRIRAPINRPDRKDEFVVFQGASYFRCVGRGHAYGMSARGLALNTGEPEGEEFPDFRSFWIEGGDEGTQSITVHALLDSPSVAGLYTFEITPGATTQMNVESVLFPRTELPHVGIAAETSMFLFDETNRNRFDDFRPAVHDSDGLLIENGAGETLWRQLANPTNLQTSSFVDNAPRGFGLMQRPRKLSDYADLEANYHKRPGLWVIPGEDWGRGAVTLVEIPADREIYDNIVAYWRPRTPLQPGTEYRYSYKLVWCDQAPLSGKLARVINTRMGKRFEGGRLASIDYAPVENMPDDLSRLMVHTSSNFGPVSQGIVQRNPATGGLRVAFNFDTGNRNLMELRSQLMLDGKPLSEVWLYRWTA